MVGWSWELHKFTKTNNNTVTNKVAASLLIANIQIGSWKHIGICEVICSISATTNSYELTWHPVEQQSKGPKLRITNK